MSAWNTRDWEPEDKSWTVTDEDCDDEFDDLALSRLGVELPECAREERNVQNPRNTGAISELFARWAEAMDNPELVQIVQDAMGSVREGDTLHFGDERIVITLSFNINKTQL